MKILLCLWEKVNGHSIHYLDFGERGDNFGINNVPVTKANIDAGVLWMWMWMWLLYLPSDLGVALS